MKQHDLLLELARELDVQVKDVSDLLVKPAALLTFKGKTELVVEGVPTSWINVSSQYYCDQKQLTKLVFEELNIPYPKSMAFTSPDDPAVKAFFRMGESYVCKPANATNGDGVLMNVKNGATLTEHVYANTALGPVFLIEEQLAGVDLRLQVINGQIVAACTREPAFVLGNGADTLASLIRLRQSVMKQQNPANHLEIDAISQRLLSAQGIQLNEVPLKGRKIVLKEVANMAQGGVAIDVTDTIHPVFQEWTTSLCDYLGTGYMGIDLIANSFSTEQEVDARVLEINARAEWLHHTFSEGKQHNIPAHILSVLFDGKVLIPNL